jgi:hypothetical protein
MKIVAIILGILLILPGLCFLAFGVGFAFSGGGGMTEIGAVEIVVGGLITWGAVALLMFGAK